MSRQARGRDDSTTVEGVPADMCPQSEAGFIEVGVPPFLMSSLRMLSRMSEELQKLPKPGTIKNISAPNDTAATNREELRTWAESNHVTVSRIPLHLTRFRQPNRHFKAVQEEVRGKNIDDVMTMIGAWFYGRHQTHLHHYYFKHIASSQILRITQGVEDGEIERPITKLATGWYDQAQWLDGYDWRVVVTCRNEGTENWNGEMFLYLKDLPRQLHDKIFWQDKNRTMKKESFVSKKSRNTWYHYSGWKDDREEPSWAALLVVEHSTFTTAILSDPRGYFPRCNRVHIDQRTSKHGYKHVAISRKHSVYGNDLLGQKTQPWTEEAHMQTAKMVEPLLPKVPLDKGDSPLWGHELKPKVSEYSLPVLDMD
ncbi:hypothetical protein CkaCkLH20_07425 [Colletotrichum karsti]|uniref:Uncharacterized protein n=1 Tax=Colletotrichum karsti TaxID=1095194 RepID=A0A9P6LGF5_9PEZI|nr:uncharacterized protein CkaCkLH20_07425 [Colletotrichum karsti]KAF9875159.1 hypothetical protein CkaCkLH20_07425 [Colletotrichum karsti]